MIGEHGHIDVLVNDIWGAELLKGVLPIEHSYVETQPGQRFTYYGWPLILLNHFPLSLPLLIKKPGDYLSRTDGTHEYNASHYRICVL
jgi:hypothetical protein